MRIRAAAVWIGMASCGFLAGGCGNDAPFRPIREFGPKVARVELDVELSSQEGSPASPITITAIAHNRGNVRVYASGYTPRLPCACDGVDIEILAPDGSAVHFFDPCVPQPVCLCAPLSLEPGTEYRRSQPWDGVDYRIVSLSPPECTQEDAPTGEYTVVVRFGYLVDWNSSPEELEKRVTFHWTGT